MRNKKVIVIVFLLSIFCVTIFTIKKYIKATNNVKILTKNAVFDIINNVEDSLISCITTDGDRHLSEENKLDATVFFIVQNKEKYIDSIQDAEYNSYKNEYQCLGKIEKDTFIQIVQEIFGSIDYDISSYKMYNAEYIYLYVEPFSYNFFDEKEVVSTTIDNNQYEVIIRYVRNLNNNQNKVYIQYILDYNLKIKDINILSSIIS